VIFVVKIKIRRGFWVLGSGVNKNRQLPADLFADSLEISLENGENRCKINITYFVFVEWSKMGKIFLIANNTKYPLLTLNHFIAKDKFYSLSNCLF
jgi:hypothetical protein